MKTTHYTLTEMTADDLKTCRAAGYSFRRELTHTVMAALTLLDDRDMRGEFGSGRPARE